MTADYTLVIPTYNRSRLLGALLRFLAAEGADFPVIVLDSSTTEHRARNRVLASQSSLKLEYVEYPEDTHPFDKFRDGVHRIVTPLGSLCADDDLVLVDGVHRCLRHLRAHSDVGVAHGYYFTFLDQGTRGIDLTAMLYFTPDIDSDEPLARIRTLLRSYQALTYGVYRTPVLQSVFAGVRPVESLLARELLSGALAVVRGKVARLRCFYGGRSHNPSEKYTRWHPLEWLILDAREFCEEYARYRAILLRELAAVSSSRFSPGDTERIIDLIHVFYVIAHAPRESHDFILDRVMEGRKLDEFWADPAIQQPLVMAHYSTGGAAPTPAPSRGRLHAIAARIADRLLPRRSSGTPDAPVEAPWPRTVETPTRVYRMHRNFLDFEPRDRQFANADDLGALLRSLDRYTEGP